MERFAVIRTKWFIIAIIVIAVLVASIIKVELGVKTDGYSRYNNYVIFKNSFLNLIHAEDLYIAHPDMQWDLYKYSPTFAFFMGPFALFPNSTGSILWSMFNALTLVIAILALPIKKESIKVSILWFILIELVTSIQNAQSNGIMAASMIMAYNYFERKNNLLAALFVALSFYIKIFGIICALLFVLYPQRFRFISYLTMWIAILLLLPLTVVSPDQLLFQYKSWWGLLTNDFSVSTGLSVMGFFKSWFGFDAPKNIVMVIGALILLLPFYHLKKYADLQYRILFLSSILLWVIIFNHKAESPTFIIAVTGIAIWYFSQTRDLRNLIFLVLAFVLTSLTPTDIFSVYLRETIVTPYVLKAVPCIFIWVIISYQLLFLKYKTALN
jgi:hypothetical protein